MHCARATVLIWRRRSSGGGIGDTWGESEDESVAVDPVGRVSELGGRPAGWGRRGGRSEGVRSVRDGGLAAGLGARSDGAEEAVQPTRVAGPSGWKLCSRSLPTTRVLERWRRPATGRGLLLGAPPDRRRSATAHDDGRRREGGGEPPGRTTSAWGGGDFARRFPRGRYAFLDGIWRAC